jgi:hypothetical protein
MSDISMCSKKDCPSFEHCYRAQAKVNEYRQAYMQFDNGDKQRCDDYVPLSPSRAAGLVPQRPSKPYPATPAKGQA